MNPKYRLPIFISLWLGIFACLWGILQETSWTWLQHMPLEVLGAIVSVIFVVAPFIAIYVTDRIFGVDKVNKLNEAGKVSRARNRMNRFFAFNHLPKE